MKTLFYIFLVAFLVAMLGFFASILTQSVPVTAEVVSIDQDNDLVFNVLLHEESPRFILGIIYAHLPIRPGCRTAAGPEDRGKERCNDQDDCDCCFHSCLHSHSLRVPRTSNRWLFTP